MITLQRSYHVKICRYIFGVKHALYPTPVYSIVHQTVVLDYDRNTLPTVMAMIPRCVQTIFRYRQMAIHKASNVYSHIPARDN